MGLFWKSVWFLMEKWIARDFHAIRIEKKEAPEIFEILESLSLKANLPTPQLFGIPSASPNLFSIGDRHHGSFMVLTYGLIKKLNIEEIEGVFAHQMAHLQMGNGWCAVFAGGVAGCFLGLIHWLEKAFWLGERNQNREDKNPLVMLASAVLIPLAAMIIRMSMPVARKFKADQMASRLTNPLYLASALRRIELGLQALPFHRLKPEWAHLWIVSPLSSKFSEKIFCSHPDIENRIACLETFEFGCFKNLG